MSRGRSGPIALFVASLAFFAGRTEARYHGDLNLFVGRKWMTQSQWAPVDEQPQIGLMLAFGEERLSVHFAVDAFLSKREVANPNPAVDALVQGSSSEFAIGVRKIWELGATRPHMGGGATVVMVEEDLDGPSGPQSNEDRAYGAWIEVGVSWRIAGHLNLGIDARYSKADAQLGNPFDPRDVDAGGFQAGALIGWGW